MLRYTLYNFFVVFLLSFRFSYQINFINKMTGGKKVIIRLLMLAFVCLLLFTTETDSKENRKCWKRKYKVEIALPGTHSKACRKNVTLHKCEGYCLSEAGPVLSEGTVRWEFRCKCCQPKKYRMRTFVFEECGGSIQVKDIRSCHCLPC